MPLIDQLVNLRKFLAAPFIVPVDFQEWLQLPAGKIYLSQIENFSQRFEQLLNSLDASSAEHPPENPNIPAEIKPVALQWKEALIGEEINHKVMQNGLIHNCLDKLQALLEKYPQLNEFLVSNIEALQSAASSWAKIRPLTLCLIEFEKSEMGEFSAQLLEASGKTPKSNPHKSGKSEISRPKINLETVKTFARELAQSLKEARQSIIATALISFANQCDNFTGTSRLKHLLVIYNGLFTYISRLPVNHPYRSYMPKICATIESGIFLKSQFFKNNPEFAISSSGTTYAEKVDNYNATYNYWETMHALLSKYLPPDLSYLESPQQQEYHFNEYARLKQKITAFLQELKKYKIELDKTKPPAATPTPPLDEVLDLTQSINPDLSDTVKSTSSNVEEITAQQTDENIPVAENNMVTPIPALTTVVKPQLQNPYAVEIRQTLNAPSLPPTSLPSNLSFTPPRGYSAGVLDLEKRKLRHIHLAAQTQGFFAQPSRQVKRTHSDFSNKHQAPMCTDEFRAELTRCKLNRKRAAEPASTTDEFQPSAPKCQA